MYKGYMSGFSLTKFLLIFTVILVLVGGGITATYFVLRQQHTAEAQLFVQDIVGMIEKDDTQTAFTNFSPSLKSDNQQSSYLTWYFWVSSFGSGTSKITITKPAESITYKDSSIISVLSSKEAITFTYKTSSGTNVSFEATKSGTEWVLNSYAAL